jgi:phosphotransferase system enzyme I (PtsI)
MTASSSQHPYPAKWIAHGISKGIATGPIAVVSQELKLDLSRSYEGESAELARFYSAHASVCATLKSLIQKSLHEVGPEEAEIFEAHLMMVEDEELLGPIKTLIESEKTIPEIAIRKQFQIQIEIFQAADSDYLRERALDLKDLESQLLSGLHPGSGNASPGIRTPSIIVAEDLTPSQTLLLDRSKILGVITEKGGPTSHSAIIARTLGIPAISGLHDAIKKLQGLNSVALDGSEGSLFIVDTPECATYFATRAQEFLAERKGLQSFIGKPSVTHDQHALRLMANIGSLSDAKDALEHDCEGVGLFRTEFLFMGRASAPTLQEQTRAYRDVLEVMAPREVVIRTLDVGGDKPIDYIRIEKEENPFLGVRALRYCFKDLPLFKTQIKAMLLANEWGNLSIMLPMVSRATEAEHARAIIDECHAELLADPLYRKQAYKVGTMVEIPSLVFEIRELKKSMSFVSVGTNDLMQYSFAVDRMNPELRNLYTPYSLGFLRMMNFLAQEALASELDLGICGELGGQDDLIPLWVAMGFKKLSMTPNEILAKRRVLSKLTLPASQGLLREALNAESGERVKILLESVIR